MDGSQSPLPPDVTRHKFTSADVQAMIAVGVIREGDHRIELITGELVEMAPQGPLHLELNRRLLNWFARNSPEGTDVVAQSPLRLSDKVEPEPEISLIPSSMNANDVRGPDVFLVVEVAYSSLRYDLNVKAPIYEVHGVREYWVVDVENRQTLLHQLSENGYGEPTAIPFSQPLAAPGGRPLVIDDLTPKA